MNNNNIMFLPIGLFAYANPKNDLDRLIYEQKAIRRIFDKAEMAGLCNLLERPAADFSTLISAFQNSRYSERICIFHFGGHSGDFELLLTDSKIQAKPFNKFIAEIHSLKLVFLNGCSTKSQAEDLRQKKIPAIIATTQEVPDDSGNFFAEIFYNGLVEGFSIKEAFNQAKETTCSRFDNCYEIQLGLSDPRKSKPEPQFLWRLYLDEENAGEWKIEKELNNPYFGLPIPLRYFLPPDPYISLKPYSEMESPIFWGRGKDIRNLYSRVIDEEANPLILVFGQSGVGKSSLLDAGLVPRLKTTTNLFYSKRISNIGLSATLQKLLNSTANSSEAYTEIIQSLSQNTDKQGVVIIIDQVEELFTKPIQHLNNELRDIVTIISEIVLSNLNIKFILSYRKEFHAEIEAEIISKRIPFSQYLLQPLSRENIIEVVNGSNLNFSTKNQYNIVIENGLDEQIADDLSRDIDSPIAPVLQILLTNLWTSSDLLNNKHQFTKKQYYDLKERGIALSDFVSLKVKEIEAWNNEVVSSGLLLDLLFFHTTQLGTSDSHSIMEIEQRYSHILSIDSIVQKCKDEYLLVDTSVTKNQISLSHDTLAPIIRSMYENSLRLGQKAVKILNNQILYESTVDKLFPLNERDLETVENGVSGMRNLSKDEMELIRVSKIAKTKNLRRKRIQNTIVRVSVVVVLMALGFALFLYSNSTKEANKSKSLYLSSEASKILKSDPTQSLHLLIAADSLLPNDEGILQNIYSLYNIAKSNLFYHKDIYTDLISPEFEVSNDKKNLIIYNSPSNNKDKTKAYLTEIDGKPLAIIQYKNKEIEKIAFVPNEEKIITLFDNYSLNDTTNLEVEKVIVVYDYLGGIIRKFEFKNDVLGFTVTKDGKQFITSEEEYIEDGKSKYRLVLRDINTGKERKIYQIGEGGAGGDDDFCWHPTENKLLFSTYDSVICLNLSDGSRISRFLKGVTNASFSPNGLYFAAGSSGTIRRDAPLKAVLWTIDGKWVADFPHTSYVWSVSFSKNSDLVLTSSWDDTVKIWGIDGRLHKAIDNKARTCYSFFTTENDKVVTVSHDFAGVSIFDTSGNLLKNIAYQQIINKAEFINDSIFVTGSVNHIKFWNLNDNKTLTQGRWISKGNYLFRINQKELTTEVENINFKNTFQNYIFDVVPLSKEIIVFTGTTHFSDRKIQTLNTKKQIFDTSIIYQLVDGKILKSFTLPGFSVKSAISNDKSSELLAVCSDGSARVIDLDGKILSVLSTKIPYHNEVDDITHAEFIKSKRTIVTLTSVGYIIYWDESGKRLNTLDFAIPKDKLPTPQGYPSGYGSFNLSSDEKLIAVFPGEAYSVLYNIESKKVDTIFNNKEGGIYELIRNGKFIQNGNFLITQNGRELDIWNTKTKSKITNIVCGPIDFYVSEDERKLLINMQNGNSIIYLLPDGIKEWIKSLNIAPLTNENKIKYEL